LIPIVLLIVALASALPAGAGATSRLPGHIKAVSPELLLMWNGEGTVDAYSTASGALVQRLPFHREVVVEAAFDPRTSTFWGAGYDVAAETRFLWEWKPGAPAIRERAFEASEVWRLDQRRLLFYRNADDRPVMARVTGELALEQAVMLPDDEEPACTFTGADTPRLTSSSYWLDGTTPRRDCPPEQCEERHWRQVRLANDAWLLCASDCLTCYERSGDAWIARSPLPRDDVHRLHALASDGRVVYAIGARDDKTHGEILRVHQSTNRGQSWQSIDLGNVAVADVVGDVFVSGGSTWIPVAGGVVQLKAGQKPRTVILTR
jgi:hypothetical protein